MDDGGRMGRMPRWWGGVGRGEADDGRWSR